MIISAVVHDLGHPGEGEIKQLRSEHCAGVCPGITGVCRHIRWKSGNHEMQVCGLLARRLESRADRLARCNVGTSAK